MSCGSLDIFSPSNCELQFGRCATNEQIQVFLWQQIKKIQIFLNNFNNNQATINDGFETNINKNANAIALLQNDVETLKTLANNLQISQTNVLKEFNNHKLSVDQTLNLYQSTINNIVKNIDSLTVDGQALQNRVGILESQTDLVKLQNIIKSYEEIKSQFSKELEDSVSQMESSLIAAIDNLDLKWNHEYSQYKLEVAATVNDITKLCNDNALAIAKLTQQFSNLKSDYEYLTVSFQDRNKLVDSTFEELEQKHDNDVRDIYEHISKEDQELRHELVLYTDKTVLECETRITASIENVRDIFKQDILRLSIELQQAVKDLTDGINDNSKAISEMGTKLLDFTLEVNKELARINRLNMQLVESNAELTKTVNKCFEACLSAVNAVNEYEKRIAKMEYDFAFHKESFLYVNSAIIRTIVPLETVISYNIKVGVIDIDSAKGTLNVNPAVYNIVGLDGAQVTTIELDLAISNMFNIVSILNHEKYLFMTTVLETGVLIEVLNHYNSEFDKVYFEPEEVETGATPEDIVDVDIHQIEPPKEDEPCCKPLHVVLVDKDCNPVEVKGKDGVDGKDGAAIVDINLDVKED